MDRTNREVKRMKDQSMAPILSNLAATVQARALSRHNHGLAPFGHERRSPGSPRL